jgi:pimeloyl-ACP methyl ester carboxylesterase
MRLRAGRRGIGGLHHRYVRWRRSSEARLVPVVYAEEFTRRLSGARPETVDGAGHAPHLEQSQLVSRILRDFCS